jgi:hypothetical protein
MSQLEQVTIFMLLFGLGVFSLGVWAATRVSPNNKTSGTAKK